MTDRQALATAFIAAAGWGAARRDVLAGDASNRRYDRLTDPVSGARAVLMDAPPDKGEDVRPFIRVARHLASLGLSAPRILAEDATAGFLLLEDLGDDLFARAIPAAPQIEEQLYSAATDLLVALHQHPAPGDLAVYDPPTMANLAALALDWYVPAATCAPVSVAERDAFCAVFETILAAMDPVTPALIQRDYHAENLLWLPQREGIARVGLLDFQDAMAGHPAYDLVSLLEDARRDVPPALQAAMLTRYITATGQDEARFRMAFAALGAQRNLRIIGVFARLCVRDGKPHYIDLLPRVWAHLMNDLTHPALAPLRQKVETLLPPVTAKISQRIREKCMTAPTH
ncbi:MAG: aminoglycoside phosphotransferase [Confluentimicrobium sp.]|uniref:aminoglycoside phosphotransferase family protein n=1 Tax=Actibacterium sp. TaxID=1872125 RepID=UPI000C6A2E7B|nr:phosphotransferase [Actibacterium sp.]MBC57098.1 aminoglycoside phosphotransferase [Actibacterium sp.]